LFLITTLAYLYPVIKHAKNKLDCEAIAKNYIIKNINTNKRKDPKTSIKKKRQIINIFKKYIHSQFKS